MTVLDFSHMNYIHNQSWFVKKNPEKNDNHDNSDKKKLSKKPK